MKWPLSLLPVVPYKNRSVFFKKVKKKPIFQCCSLCLSFSAARDHDAAFERPDCGEEGYDCVAAVRRQGQPRARPQLEQGQRPDAQERGVY